MISIQNNDQFVNSLEIGDALNDDSNLQVFITVPNLALAGDYMLVTVKGPDDSEKIFFHIRPFENLINNNLLIIYIGAHF